MRLLSLLSFFCVYFLFFSSQSSADLGRHEITLDINDTTVTAGTTGGYLSIYIDNYFYEVFGFQTVLKSNRPDLVLFDCSNGGFDTIGTLTGGFEYVAVSNPAGDGSSVWFRCIADLFYIPGHVDGFLPQQGGVAVKIPFIITHVPDTSLSLSSLISIETPTDFSDPFGYSIGVETDTLYDTIFLVCESYVGNECTNWEEVTDTLSGYDMIVYDTTPYGYMDTNQVKLYDGSITLKLINCDINISGELEITDLLCFVDYVFGEIDPLECPFLRCDANGNGQVDISDLLYLIDYVFGDGPPPK